MRRWWVLALLVLALPVRAGLFDDDEARARIDKLRADLGEVSKRLDTASKNQIDFANQAEALRSDLARLRGQIEVLVNDLDSLQKRQKDFYVDLDSRLRKLESAAAAAAAQPPKDETPPAKPVDPAAETRDYEAALMAFRGAKYKEAQAGFLAFIKAYPNSMMLPSAHFWAASSHYQLKEYPKAAELFAKVAESWPADAKAPDALMGQANALEAAGDLKGARAVLESLVQKHPNSSAAQAARQRLKTLPVPRKK